MKIQDITTCWLPLPLLLLLLLSGSGSDAFSPNNGLFSNNSPLQKALLDQKSNPNHQNHHASSSSKIKLNAAPPTEKDLQRFQSYGEASRKFRRSYFSHSDWLKARADDRFFYNLSSILRSGIVRQLGKELMIVGGVAGFVIVWNALFVAGFDDLSGFHHVAPLEGNFGLLKLPSQPFTWSSSSLGLLLVFRTNTAFKRWDEGRKAWGQIINNSRTAARLGTQWADAEPNDIHKEKLRRLADAVWSFPRSLQYHMLGPLEDGADYARDVQLLADKRFADDLLAVRHKPTRALKEITQVFATINFKSVIYQVEAEKSVTALCDALGACERIFTSPPPLFYSRHTARFLVTWVFLLPFCLYEPFAGTWNHWGMIPTSIVIAYFLLGIEELAAQMEEPFSILPMDKMTGGIRLSADEHVEWKQFTDETFGDISPTATTSSSFDPYYTDTGDGGDLVSPIFASAPGDVAPPAVAPPAAPATNYNGNDNSMESFLRGQK